MAQNLLSAANIGWVEGGLDGGNEGGGDSSRARVASVRGVGEGAEKKGTRAIGHSLNHHIELYGLYNSYWDIW